MAKYRYGMLFDTDKGGSVKVEVVASSVGEAEERGRRLLERALPVTVRGEPTMLSVGEKKIWR
ncbi:MAG: hypothetical protein PHU95_03565 [Candidatus Thermoplasmatota archaeon]|nr:hypothetical protein [Candidatus Thermoplasmatota archaeon]MDD5778506.1 hypothetical protein [Candidatus Thermoplasmatota archaeon]